MINYWSGIYPGMCEPKSGCEQERLNWFENYKLGKKIRLVPKQALNNYYSLLLLFTWFKAINWYN